MTQQSWVGLHSIAHNFIELHKPFYHKAVIYDGKVQVRDTLKEGEV